MTDADRITELEKRLAAIEAKPVGFDLSKVLDWLPSPRSLIWLASGIGVGAGGTAAVMPTQPVVQKAEPIVMPKAEK